jgi:glycosyltransferase involved in cell wall biosynthesis
MALKHLLLVPSLRLEGWKAMDRYAAALARELPAALGSGWQVTQAPDPAYPRWSRFAARWVAYPRAIRWEGWDVVHVLDHSYAHILHRRRGTARAVVTVHDLQAFDYPGRHRSLRGRTLRRINRWVLDGITQADACLCDSRATLRSVASHFPDMAARSRHQPLGVDRHFFVDDLTVARTAGRKDLGLSARDRVVLHVGSCVPRKGIDDLLAALVALVSRDRRLVLVQVGGHFTTEQRRLIERLGVASRVLQRSFVPERLLPAAYAAADVVAMPSLFEGFALPVLEAFAVGVPVVSRRHGALAEFPADLLFTVLEDGIDALAAQIENALRRRDEAEHKAALARHWAEQFTWAEVARGTAQAYL